MKPKILFGVLILSVCLVLVWILSYLDEPVGPVAEGGMAPEITFVNQAGRSFSLKDFRGKVVLLNFWATWCAPCREEMPSLNALQHHFENQPLSILAFSVDDSWAAVLPFLRQGGYTLPVFADFDRKTATRFGTLKFPETYILDKQGRVQLKIIGDTNWMAPEMVSTLHRMISSP
jgi:cytochrome c biogenesis protein CcmG, thiol:disulfide interchange protein DsbE